MPSDRKSFNIDPRLMANRLRILIEREFHDNRFAVKVDYLDGVFTIYRYARPWVCQRLMDKWIGSFSLSDEYPREEFATEFVAQTENLVLEGDEWLAERLPQFVWIRYQ